MIRNKIIRLFSAGLSLLAILACNAVAPAVTPTAVVPSPVPATATAAVISQQVTLVAQESSETNQTPLFTIKSQIPQLTGSDDPRVTAFNQRAHDLVTKEVDAMRKSFLENTAPPVSENGSSLDATYSLISQLGDVWSFKFDFSFYADGAAHPGLYSTTLNYDLAQGRELALADLFLPNSNYLDVISQYCIAELSKREFFDSSFSEGAQPTVENYRNWNIAPDGLLITFDEYQVAPYAAGPQAVTIPYSELKSITNPAGPLGSVIQ